MDRVSTKALSSNIVNVVTLLVVAIFLFSCVQNQGVRSGKHLASQAQKAAGKTNGPAAGPGSGSFGSLLTDITENGKSELRLLVDPIDGTFRKKITIPKNFTGFFYLSGLNITALSNRLISVRFNFGREMESVTVPATVARAAGLTPQTDIDVLILDMHNRPFENIRLLYDLYDYNDYRTSPDVAVETKEPTLDPRNPGLYCRGLKLEHDPTFNRTSTNNKCDTKGERCLYAYAKIRDNSLFQHADPTDLNSAWVTGGPSLPQVDFQGSGYPNELTSNNVKKCLPDNFNLGEFNSNYHLGLTSLGMNKEFTLGSGTGVQTYRYQGPFRAIGESQWEIGKNSDGTDSAVFFDTLPGTGSGIGVNYPAGLFLKSGDAASSRDPNAGYGSFLFPRAGKMALNPEIDHFSSVNPFGDGDPATRTLNTLVAAGTTAWMYGCNTRVTNYDAFTNEGIGSCNVTATIEMLTEENGKEVILATSTAVKLQLIRPSLTNYQGQEVLYTSMKTCSSSRSCGGNECCFNNRCWDRSLVSQCLDDVAIQGNRAVGETCQSDYECSSLCCNVSTSTCAVHTNIGTDPVLCSKSPGQKCVAQEWCRKANISDCYIVKTGISPTNVQECALRCYNVPTFGTCRDGECRDPIQPVPPAFDPANPDCSSARDPLTTLPN